MKIFGIFYTNDFCVHIAPSPVEWEATNSNLVSWLLNKSILAYREGNFLTFIVKTSDGKFGDSGLLLVNRDVLSRLRAKRSQLHRLQNENAPSPGLRA